MVWVIENSKYIVSMFLSVLLGFGVNDIHSFYSRFLASCFLSVCVYAAGKG